MIITTAGDAPTRAILRKTVITKATITAGIVAGAMKGITKTGMSAVTTTAVIAAGTTTQEATRILVGITDQKIFTGETRNDSAAAPSKISRNGKGRSAAETAMVGKGPRNAAGPESTTADISRAVTTETPADQSTTIITDALNGGTVREKMMKSIAERIPGLALGVPRTRTSASAKGTAETIMIGKEKCQNPGPTSPRFMNAGRMITKAVTLISWPSNECTPAKEMNRRKILVL